MLKFEHIVFSYRSAGVSVRAIDDVSLSVAPGERVVLLGANGSGKSTLVRMANAMLLPDEGSITVDGISTIDPATLRELRTTVGVVAQDPESQIVSSSVLDDVAFGPENLGLPVDEISRRVFSAIAAVGLTGKEKREPHTLSGGEKQRLVIAGVLAMDPAYVILDEPSSMLDANGRADVRAALSMLHATGRGVLHITHDLAECVSADRVAVMRKGRIVFTGTPQKLLSDLDSLKDKGLSLPPILDVASSLGKAGVELPVDPTDPVALAEALFASAGLAGDGISVDFVADEKEGTSECR